MTNKFNPTKRLQSLYCVWINTGNPRRPLECFWIDSEMRGFQDVSLANNESIPVSACGTEGKRIGCIRKKASPTRRGFESLRKRRRSSGLMNRGARSLTRILIALTVLLTSAWADVGGRIGRPVADSFIIRDRQNLQFRKALLPTATKSLIKLYESDELVTLRLRQSQLGRKRVGLICQNFQVIGGSGLEANL
jgi:hypothetical protein